MEGFSATKFQVQIKNSCLPLLPICLPIYPDLRSPPLYALYNLYVFTTNALSIRGGHGRRASAVLTWNLTKKGLARWISPTHPSNCRSCIWDLSPESVVLVANTFINQVRGKKNSPAAKPVNRKSQVAFSRSTQQKDSLQNIYLTTQQTTLCKQKRSQIFTIAKTGQTQTGCNRFMFASQLQNSLVFFHTFLQFFFPVHIAYTAFLPGILYQNIVFTTNLTVLLGIMPPFVLSR